MKILFLCTYYHRAMIFRDLMDNLALYGDAVKAFNICIKGEKVAPQYLRIMDDQVTHIERFSKWDRYFYFHKQRKFYKALVEQEDVQSYQLIHSHMLFTGGYVSYLIHKRFHVPFVVSVRSTDISFFLRIPFFKGLANRIIEQAAGVVFISQAHREEFIRRYVNQKNQAETTAKSTVIMNGLEPFWHENRSTPKQLLAPKTVRVLYAGKIVKRKNLPVVIAALKMLQDKGYRVSFTVVGRVVNQNLFDAIQKESFVKVLKPIAKEELLHVYREHDIYVMPSQAETFGRVYAEAMSQGLPVIYSQGEGFDRIYPDGCVGYAVPSKDPAYIAECIEKIIGAYAEISKNCVKYSADFDWKQIAGKLSSFYKEVLHKEEDA